MKRTIRRNNQELEMGILAEQNWVVKGGPGTLLSSMYYFDCKTFKLANIKKIFT